MRTKHLSALLSVLLLAAASADAQEDPGVAGPHPVATAEYTSTDVGLGCVGSQCTIQSEMLAQVHYPSDLSNGPFPLVIILHGRHAPCYNLTSGEGNANWPCGTGLAAVPSYKGYDYVASLLASHGIIAVSISANAINSIPPMTGSGDPERAELMQLHLDRWKTFSTTGAAPFGTSFVGRVDLTRVGTMGHSRGGRAVFDHFALNASKNSPYGIRAVLPLAPANGGPLINNTPLAVMIGYCDGDTGLDGVRYFDDSRYSVPDDNSPKYVFLGMGANHNYYNRFWTPDQFAPGTCCSANPPAAPACQSGCVSTDDWKAQSDAFCGINAAGNGRLSSAQQRNFAKAYVAAFFRRHLQSATQFDPLLEGDDLPPPSTQNTTVYQSYFPGILDRKDLNRLAATENLTTNTLTGGTAPTEAAPTSTGLAQYNLCGPGTSPTGGFTSCVTVASRKPHNTTVQLELGWASLSATYSNFLPIPQRDVSNFEALQFRVGVDYSDTRNSTGQPQDFSIRIVDGGGRSSTIRASDYSDALYYPPGSSSNRASVLSTLRVPMNAMLSVDLTNIVSVDLLFNQKATGGILVSDMAFAGEGISASEKWLAATEANF